ncbi:hypothetical protein [Streptosporangium carneum]|uniref:Secreted protein n=1 Tax=Streptosporangium carneum TaxID=47481 RepID=A0A9W6I8G4_9ACTN|nr:hypothetical protein [Streptosporangium carneum]GLK13563.1 hypothetical protein GCM10017600_69740 [Streptosporangium carneum]
MADTRIRIAALVMIPLILAGCGQGAGPGVDSTGNGTAAGASPNPSADPAKYASCLREHGLTVVEDGDSLRIDAPDPKTGDAAREACKQYAPDRPGMSGEEKKKIMDQALAFTACMRRRGVTMADPEQNAEGGVKLNMPQGAEGDSPAVQAAQQACRSLMPGRPR